MDNEDRIVEYLARMCIIIIFGLIIATILTLCSCTRTIYVPQVSAERDSIYLHTHTRDSIIVRDSVTIREKGDTVWLTHWRTEYRDRIRIDTAYIERRDSVAVPYPVERKLSARERFYMSAGKVALPAAAVCAALIIYRYRRRPT